ncbi:MAG: hypothetical protein ACYS0E_04685 [Planctomycetota bacterium]|jgi:hypothetical protein
MLRIPILFLLVACGGGGTPPAIETPPVQLDPEPAPQAQPQQPPVEAEVIGLAGQPVPGLNASYVSTALGWLGPQGDVVFEGVVQWRHDLTLGCGILRRSPNGRVNTLLMQGQPLPGTGGRVKHPKLPIETRGDTLVMPAEVADGIIEHGLFAVPRGGGSPKLLAEGRFTRAIATPDGTVFAQREEDRSVVRIPPDAAAELLCPGCEPGFSTDGNCVVVRRNGSAWVIEQDGSERRIIGIDDLVPATAGTVTYVRGAWVNDAGAFVVHVQTSDKLCPEALLRFTDEVEALAICGAAAPGTNDVIRRIRVAGGRSSDVVFTAGTEQSGNVVYCARPGESPVPVAASTPAYRIREADVVADGARIAFGANLTEGANLAELAVYRVRPGAQPERVMSTDAAVPAAGNALLRSFPIPLGEAIDIDGNGVALVHAGLVESRRPDATLGALLLVR